MSSIVKVNPSKINEDDYFKIERTICNTTLLNISKTHDSIHDESLNSDPFENITQISILGFLFSRNTYKSIADGSRTYYFKCLNQDCNERARINVKKVKEFNYSLHYDESPKHLPSCKRSNEEHENFFKIQERLKLFAQEMYRNNNEHLSKAKIKAIIITEYIRYLIDHPGQIFPVLKSTTIESWFNSTNLIKSSMIKMSNIPIDLWKLNGGWVYSEQRWDNNYMIFLSFPKMRNFSKSATKLIIDGTFHAAPDGFYQVLNGIGYIPMFGKFCPLFHVLLENKRENTYRNALLFIFQSFGFDVLNTIHIDFELGFFNVLDAFFPILEPEHKRKFLIQGCLFHFKQCLTKYFEKLYLESDQLEKYLTAFLLTPYLHDHDYFEFIEKMKKENVISEFYNYFINNWGPNGVFPRTLWKVSDKDPDAQLTSDGAERFHMEMNKTIDSPNLEVFIKKLAELDYQIIVNLENSLNKSAEIYTTRKITPYEARLKINELFPRILTSRKSIIPSKIKSVLEIESMNIPDELIIPFENSHLVKEKVKHKCRIKGKRKHCNKKLSSNEKRVHHIAATEELISKDNSDSPNIFKENEIDIFSDSDISEILDAPLKKFDLRKRATISYKDREFSAEEEEEELSSDSENIIVPKNVSEHNSKVKSIKRNITLKAKSAIRK